MGRNSTSHFPSIFDPLPLKRIPPKIKKFKKILKLNQNCEKVNFKKIMSNVQFNQNRGEINLQQ